MILLVAAVLDRNNEILLIAQAVVSIENADNQTWFLKEMKLSFKGIDLEDMVFISDRDKGLQTAVHEVFPKTHYLHYSQHLADNIQKNYSFICWNLFSEAANIYYE